MKILTIKVQTPSGVWELSGNLNQVFTWLWHNGNNGYIIQEGAVAKALAEHGVDTGIIARNNILYHKKFPVPVTEFDHGWKASW